MSFESPKCPRDSCRSTWPTSTPALPFCHLRLLGKRPTDYPRVLNTLGDHLQKRRFELGLQWKEVAGQIGTHATNVALWSKNHSRPGLAFWPRIIRFLGYDPRRNAATFGQMLRRHREGEGLSQEGFAAKLQVDPSTLARWERDERAPTGEFLTRVQRAVRIPMDSLVRLPNSS